MWKSQVKSDSQTSSFDLLGELKQGRYLIDTNEQPTSFLFVWVIVDRVDFQHFKIDSVANLKDPISLSLATLRPAKKKIFFKCFDLKEQPTETAKAASFLEQLRNDINVNELTIGRDYFETMRKKFDSSAKEICDSLRESNEYQIAIV